MKSYASNVQAAKESYDKTAQSLAEFLKNIQDNKGQKKPSAYAYIALLDITVTLFLAFGPGGPLALALKNLLTCIGALMAVKRTYNLVSAKLTKSANDTLNPAETLKKRLEDSESKQLENADAKSKNPIPAGYKDPLHSLVNFSENLSLLSRTVQKQRSNSSLNTSDVKGPDHKNNKTNLSK